MRGNRFLKEDRMRSSGSKLLGLFAILFLLFPLTAGATVRPQSPSSDPNDFTGFAVAIDGNYAAIAAPNADETGAVFVYRWDGSAWNYQTRLSLPATLDSGDQFGASVAISGSATGNYQIAVGAPGDDGTDNNSSDAGAIYFFERVGDSWVFEQRFTPGDLPAANRNGDQLGTGVDIISNATGIYAVAGAPGDNIIDQGVNSGAIWLFRKSGGVWEVDGSKRYPAASMEGDEFGRSVAISFNGSGFFALAGGPNADEGMVAVFQRSGSTWVEQPILTASGGADGDLFGVSVDLEGNTAIVGASRSDDLGSSSGSAYVFTWDGTDWNQQAKLLASDGAPNDRFGRAVSVSGDFAFIGAPQHGEGPEPSGAAYVFERSGTSWSEIKKVSDPNGEPNAQFGRSVGIYENPDDPTDVRTVIGAPESTPGKRAFFDDAPDDPAETNFAPLISQISDVTLIAQLPADTAVVPFTISDAETPAASLSVARSWTAVESDIVTGGSLILAGDEGNRTLSITPAAGAQGTARVTLTVTDADGASTHASFLVIVTDPPTLSGLNDEYTVNVDNPPLEVNFTVDDNQDLATALTVSAVSANPALVGDPTVTDAGADRTLTLTPNAGQSGSAQITVSVTDTDNNTTTETFLLLVNGGPTFVSVSPTTVETAEDTASGTVTVTLQDEEGGDLTLTAKSQSEALVANGAGGAPFYSETRTAQPGQNTAFSFTLSPVADANGDGTILLEAFDAAGAKSSRTFSFTVTPAPDPPIIDDVTKGGDSILGTTLEIPEDGSTGTLQILVRHPDAQPGQPKTMTVSVSSANGILVPPGNIQLNGNDTNALEVNVLAGQSLPIDLVMTPAADQIGTDTILIQASDENGAVEEQFTLRVVEANDAPTITSISSPQNTEEDVPLEDLAFTVGDEETEVGDLEVTATSDNPDLIPNSPDNLKVEGFGANRMLTVTPAKYANSPDFGNATITLTVSDDGINNDPDTVKTATTAFQVSVAAVNNLPTIDGIKILEQTQEDQPLEIAPITVCDVDGDSLVVKIATNNTDLFPDSDQNLKLSYNGVTLGRTLLVENLVDSCSDPAGNLKLTLIPAPNASGTAEMSLTVTDDQNESTTKTFEVFVQFVNEPPEISGTPPSVAYTNQPYEFTPTVSDEEDALSELTFDRTCFDSDSDVQTPDGCPAWLQFDETTGTLSGTPGPNELNELTTGIRITVTDTGGEFASLPRFDLQVLKDPQPPTLSGISNQTTPEDQPLDISFSVADENGDPVTFSFTSSNLNLVDPATDPATDPGGLQITGPDISVDGMGRFTLPATPSDGSPVNLNLRITPKSNANNSRDGGPTTVTLTVEDVDGETAQQTFVLDVTAVPDPPSLEGIVFNQQETIPENGELQFSDIGKLLVVGDVDGGILTISAVSKDIDQDLLPNDNIKVFALGGSPGFEENFEVPVSEGNNYQVPLDLLATPAANLSGQATVTVTVSDGDNSTDAAFLLNVTNENNNPEILTITPPVSMTEGTQASVPFTVRDWDNDTLTLAATVEPADIFSDIRFSGDGVTLDANQNYEVPVQSGEEVPITLDVTGAAGQFGEATVTLTVRDVANAADPPATRTFVIDVTNINDPPTIPPIDNRTVDEDSGPHEVPFTINDPDGDNLRVSVQAQTPNLIEDIGILVNGTPLTLPQFIPPESYDQLRLTLDTLRNANGNAVIDVTVDDGTANPVTTSFTLIIDPVPDAPVLTPVMDQTLNEDDQAPSPNPIGLTVRDPDGGTATLLLRSGDTAGTVLPNQTDNLFVSGPQGVVVDLIQSLDAMNREVVKATLDLPPNTEVNLDMRLTPVKDAFTEPGPPIPVFLTLQDATPETADAADAFNVTVLDINDPPSISPIVGPKFTNASTKTDPILFNLSDPETPVDDLIVDWESSDTSIVPNGNITVSTSTQPGFNRQLEILPLDQEGETTITVTVVDGQGEPAQTIFELKVRDGVRQPDIDGIDLKATDEDSSISFTAAVSFPLEAGETLSEVLEVRVSSGNIDLIPNGSPYIQVNHTVSNGDVHSYEITLTPAEDQPVSDQTEETTMTVLAITKLANSFTDEETFPFRVDPLPDPPVLLDIPPDDELQETEENVPYVLDFRVKDPDGDALTISVESNNNNLFRPENLVIDGVNSSGVVTPDPPGAADLKLTATPTANLKNQTAIITITAEDGTNPPSELAGSLKKFTIRVNESGCPVVSDIPDQETVKDVPITGISFTITDQEGGTIDVSAGSSNANLISESGIGINGLNPDGTILAEPGVPVELTLDLTPNPGGSGSATINIFAEDPSGKVCPKSFQLNVRAARPGDIDANGVVELTDVILGLQVLAGMAPANATQDGDLVDPENGTIGLEEVIYDLQVVAEIR